MQVTFHSSGIVGSHAIDRFRHSVSPFLGRRLVKRRIDFHWPVDEMSCVLSVSHPRLILVKDDRLVIPSGPTSLGGVGELRTKRVFVLGMIIGFAHIERCCSGLDEGGDEGVQHVCRAVLKASVGSSMC